MGKYNFDEIIDRKITRCRKWDNTILKEKFGLSSDAIPMDIADMDFKSPPEVVEAIVERAMNGTYGYTYTYNEYYEAIINWNKKRYNVDIKKEWITLTFGTVSTLHYIVQAFCDKKDKVMINTPAYDPFREAVLRQRCDLICSTLVNINNRYFLDFEDIEDKFKNESVKLFIFCSPQNPSGRIWSKHELNRLSELCIKYNVLLVSDEIHRDVVFEKGKFTTLWNANDLISNNSIVCVSPNKGFNLGGLKSSYVIIKDEKIRNMLKKSLEKNSITSPHVFAQPALIAAYTKGEEWLEELTEYIEENFKILENSIKIKFPKAKYMKPESSFLAWIDMREEFQNEDDIREFFTRANVTLVYGSYFVQDGEGFIRINVGCPRKILEEAIGRIESTPKKQ